jgi:hypothetical protein
MAESKEARNKAPVLLMSSFEASPGLCSADIGSRSPRAQGVLVMQPTEHRFAPHGAEVVEKMARPQH